MVSQPQALRLLKARPDIRRAGVGRTADFLRISGISRRPDGWEEPGKYDDLVDLMTNHFKTPNGTMELKPIQAMSLVEALDNYGLLGPIAVGRGKGLLTLLLATLLVEEGIAKRPLILVPSQLEHQTRTLVIPEMSRHWRITPELRLLSYETLSSMKSVKALYNICPDAIIADEAHKLKDIKNAARTSRFLDYFKEYPDTLFFGVSGTITKRSLNDYAHLSLLALGMDSPLPVSPHELKTWCLALDSNVAEAQRIPPGALWEFADGAPDDSDPLAIARVRAGFRKRLSETPGVVCTWNNDIGIGLDVIERRIKVPFAVSEAFEKVRSDWVTPSGDEIPDGLSMARICRQLANGFYYRWNPMPPIEWLRARSEWFRWCRNFIRYQGHHHGIDTKGLLEAALHAERFQSDEFEAWLEVKDTFKVNVEAVWIDDFLVRDAEKWAKENKGIVWVTHHAVGEKFKTIPYFRGGHNEEIEKYQYKGSCAASIKAHGTGKNLQFGFAKNLFLDVPGAGDALEQTIGRTHRMGQKEETVSCHLYLHTRELWNSLRQARLDEPHLEMHTGTTKIGAAFFDVRSEREVEDLVQLNDPLWVKSILTDERKERSYG